MPYLVDESDEGQVAYKTLVVKPRNFSVLNSDLSLKILAELSKEPSCAMDVARRLKQHEQKIYYHFRRLEKAGIIKLERTEERVGALTKIFSVSYPFISVKLFEGQPLIDKKTKVMDLDFLKPFIESGKLNSLIVIGSPDSHGRYGAQASDGNVAIDLGLFLGSFLHKHTEPNYKLDTEVRDKDLKNNLILIGGPKANIYIEKLNKNLPIYFDASHEFDLVSSFSKTIYSAEDIGIVIKTKSPFAKDKEVLIIAGKRFKGTRAATVALIKHMKEISKGNKHNGGIARIVRGIDRDSDGRIDDVEFLE